MSDDNTPSGESAVKKVFLIILLLALLSVNAAAVEVDMEYNGIIDSYTGLPVGQPGIPEGVDRVWINSELFYDVTTNRFVYELFSGTELFTTVVDGMITTGPVSMELSNGATGRLYRNGELLDMTEYKDLTTPGNYVLSVNSNTGVTIEPVSFTIVGSVTCVPEEYVIPEGFVFVEALRNNEAIEYSDRQVNLTDEGIYRLTYECRNTGLQYGLETEIDRTPPVLELAGVEDGVAKGPVTLYDLEQGASLLIERDGKTLGFTQELTESGNYHLWLQDPAGNSTDYQFKIQIYLNINAIVFVVLILVLIGFLVFYLIYSRRKLRVR